MSAYRNNPVFPQESATVRYFGLTKRELFAAMALQGLASIPLLGETPSGAVKSDTERAVSYADALIAELAKDGAA